MDAAISELASRQEDVVAARQLRLLGLSDDDIAYRKRIKRLHPFAPHRGVYTLGTTRTPRARFWAAYLAAGDETLISHLSAAHLQGLLLRPNRRIIDVTSPRHQAGNEVIRPHWSRAIHPDDRDAIDGLPVTAWPRTLLDVADTTDLGTTRAAVSRTLELQIYDQRQIDALLGRTRGRKGITVLKAAVRAATRNPTLTESRTEELLLSIVHQAKLPEPLTQYPIGPYRADFAWPGQRLAVEVDGPHHLLTADQIAHDRLRDEAFRAVGWTVRRFRYDQVLYEPEYVARTIAGLLSRSVPRTPA